jgi:hypothetical protein
MRTRTSRVGERGSVARWAAYVALPLVVGASVYFVRGPGASLVHWRRAHLARMVVGTLPDAAWAFALGATLCLLWRTDSRSGRSAWMAIGGALAVGYEAAQGLGLVPGTFDPLDLFASAAAYVAALLLLGRTPPARAARAAAVP